jgi:hypothetical protein
LSGGQRVTQTILAIWRRVRTFIGSASVIVVAAATSLGEVHADSVGRSAAEDWAQSKILQGLPADFNEQCGELDARRVDDPAWADPNGCRTLTAAFLVDILTHPDDRKVPDAGVKIQGAKIVDDLGLAFVKLKRFVTITNSRFEGKISLDDARSENKIDLTGSSLSGFEAPEFHSDSTLRLSEILCKGKLDLQGAQFKGDLDMIDAHVRGEVNANALQVGGAIHMHSSGQTQSSFHDVSLIGAKVVGDLDMVAVRVDGNLNAHGLQVGGSLDAHGLQVGGSLIFRSDTESGRQASVSGAVTLEGAHIQRELNLDDAQVETNLDANALQVGGALHMRSGRFHDVSLIGANVVGDVDMVGIRTDGILNTYGLQVGGSLVLRSDATGRQSVFRPTKSGRAIDLTSAKVAGNVEMDGVFVDGAFDAAGLQVGASLLMRPDLIYVASVPKISLGGAKIDGRFDMTGARVNGLDAPSLQVNGSVRMCASSRDCSFQDIELRGARVTGDLDMPGVKVVGKFNAAFARIEGNLNMIGANVAKFDAPSLHVSESLLTKSDENPGASRDEITPASFGEVALGNAKIDGNLNLPDASAKLLDAPSLRVGGNLDLSAARIIKVILVDAVVGGYIKVGAKDGAPTIDELDLQNARAGSLLDNSEKSWPTKMRLGGFTFSRLGPEMITRNHDKWDEWVRRDKTNSSYPYEQLAAAHAAAGDRDAADAFHYAERVRATENENLPKRALSYVLRFVAGYGIGYYMFNALWWALGLAVLGAMVLWMSVQGVAEGNRGFWWCFGASVDRLLPFITLKKEFSEFFDNKEVNRFTRWQDLFFIVFGVLGWVLGAIVLAAMGTFTKGS